MINCLNDSDKDIRINSDDTSYFSEYCDVISYNLFSYCGNNSINRSDISGHFWEEYYIILMDAIQQARGMFVAAGMVSQIDSPMPGIGDILGGIIASVALVVVIEKTTYSVVYNKTKEKSSAKAKEKTATKAVSKKRK